MLGRVYTRLDCLRNELPNIAEVAWQAVLSLDIIQIE